MEVTRRDLLKLVAIAGGVGLAPRALAVALKPDRLLEFQAVGNVTLLHMTDPHATLLPVYYREPDTLLGVKDEAGKPPLCVRLQHLWDSVRLRGTDRPLASSPRVPCIAAARL